MVEKSRNILIKPSMNMDLTCSTIPSLSCYEIVVVVVSFMMLLLLLCVCLFCLKHFAVTNVRHYPVIIPS